MDDFTLWNVLGLVLRTSIWQILVNVPQALGKNTYPDNAGCSTLWASVRLKVLLMFKSSILLMIFSLYYQLVTVLYFCCFETKVLGASKYKIIMPSW